MPVGLSPPPALPLAPPRPAERCGSAERRGAVRRGAERCGSVRRSGAERRGAERGAAGAGGGCHRAAGAAAPGRPGRGAEPPSGRGGEPGRRRSAGGICMGGSRGNPLSPPRSVPGCRAGARAGRAPPEPPPRSAASRSPSSPGGETFRRVPGSSQINHGAALRSSSWISLEQAVEKQAVPSRALSRTGRAQDTRSGLGCGSSGLWHELLGRPGQVTQRRRFGSSRGKPRSWGFSCPAPPFGAGAADCEIWPLVPALPQPAAVGFCALL